MKTVEDIEEIREELKEIFPDAIRGSVAKSNWYCGRKQLHLSYWIGSDTVGGYIVQAKGNLFYFIEWDTNNGVEYKFAESDKEIMINRIRKMFNNRICYIDK